MQEETLHIRLPRDHWTYLVDSVELPEHLLEKLKKDLDGATQASHVEVALTAGEADEIRGHCAEHLQLRGFDESYNHTKDGRMLEDLIDYFFTG